jgi:predicted metal-binding protein|tara:strand:- start:351 stop:509 length:159 start_codon:yes stop_codon:yes gene_type:complete
MRGDATRSLKALANMLRAYHEGTEGWTNWYNLPPTEQKKWLDKVDELGLGEE